MTNTQSITTAVAKIDAYQYCGCVSKGYITRKWKYIYYLYIWNESLFAVWTEATSEFQLEHMPRLPCSICPADYQIQTIEHGKVLVVKVFRKYYSRYVHQLSEYMKWRTAARRNDTMEELLSTFLNKVSHITTRHMTKQFPSPGRRWGLVLAEIHTVQCETFHNIRISLFFLEGVLCVHAS